MLPFRENIEKLASNGSTKRQDPCGNNPFSRLQYERVQDPGGEASTFAGLHLGRGARTPRARGASFTRSLFTPSSAPPMSLLQCLSTITSLLAASTALPLTYFLFLPLHTLATNNRNANN